MLPFIALMQCCDVVSVYRAPVRQNGRVERRKDLLTEA